MLLNGASHMTLTLIAFNFFGRELKNIDFHLLCSTGPLRNVTEGKIKKKNGGDGANTGGI